MAEAEPVLEVTAGGSFDDVKQQLLLAIENRGLLVSHESKVGEMLERTGKDLPSPQPLSRRARGLLTLSHGERVAPCAG